MILFDVSHYHRSFFSPSRAVQTNTPIGHVDRWRQLRESSEDFLTKWLGTMEQSNSEEDVEDDEFNGW